MDLRPDEKLIADYYTTDLDRVDHDFWMSSGDGTTLTLLFDN